MPQTMTETFVAGPSDRRRGRGTCYVGGEATDGERTVTSRLKTPETYALTVDAATTAAGRVLDGAHEGFETHAAAFALELDDSKGSTTSSTLSTDAS